MKKRCLAMLLAVVLAVSLLPGTALAAAAPTQQEAYAAMIAMKSEYPEGMKWNNDDFYAWRGGIYSGGYGCAGFAFLLSDAAFGSLPARKVTDVKFSDVRVGDILRVDNNSHSVIILEVRDSSVMIAEGNYNNSIHWGRILSKAQVEAANYMLTRYPVEETPTQPAEPGPAQPVEPEPTDPEPSWPAEVEFFGTCGKNLTWTLKNGVLTIKGTGAMDNFGTQGGLDMPWYMLAIFYGVEIHTVVIGSGVTSIGNNAFYMAGYSDGLTGVTIPASVTSIGLGAFDGCASLTDVYYGGSAEQWNKISVGDDNAPLFRASIHCADTKPAEPEPELPTKYNDVPVGAYYANAVNWAVDNEITKGTGNKQFSPKEICSEVEILTMLYRASGETASTTAPIPVASWYQDAVNWAYGKGMIGDDFNPSKPCSRAAAVNYIWQALGKEDAPARSYTDVDAGAYYADAVSWAVNKGVTKGTGNKQFSPDRTCMREEIVTFLYRAYN